MFARYTLRSTQSSEKGVILLVCTHHSWLRPLTCLIPVGDVAAESYGACAVIYIASKASLTFIALPGPRLLRENNDLLDRVEVRAIKTLNAQERKLEWQSAHLFRCSWPRVLRRYVARLTREFQRL